MAENITKADLHFQVSTCNHFDEKLLGNANFEISSPFNSDLTNIFQNIATLIVDKGLVVRWETLYTREQINKQIDNLLL